MPLASKSLYYQRSNGSFNINLYTLPTDVGAQYLAIRSNGIVYYAPYGQVTDPLSSHLRIQKGTQVYAILTSVPSTESSFISTLIGKFSGDPSVDVTRIWDEPTDSKYFVQIRKGTGTGVLDKADQYVLKNSSITITATSGTVLSWTVYDQSGTTSLGASQSLVRTIVTNNTIITANF